MKKPRNSNDGQLENNLYPRFSFRKILQSHFFIHNYLNMKAVELLTIFLYSKILMFFFLFTE